MNTEHIQPIIHAPDYGRVDGRAASSDHQASLAMGLKDGPVVTVSAERETVLPLHRVLDAAVFALTAMVHLRESYRYPQGYDPAHPVLRRVGLQGDAMSVAVEQQDEALTAHLVALSDSVARDGDLLGERLSMLRELLNDLGY